MEQYRGWPAVIVLVVAAVVCVVIAILYYEGAIQILTRTGSGRHTTHAILFGGLALVCLIAGSFMRPRADVAR
jgi:hypothetical protein